MDTVVHNTGTETVVHHDTSSNVPAPPQSMPSAEDSEAAAGRLTRSRSGEGSSLGPSPEGCFWQDYGTPSGHEGFQYSNDGQLDGSETAEMCLIVDTDAGDTWRDLLKNIKAAGMQTKCFRSPVSQSQIFVMVSATFEWYDSRAEQYKMQYELPPKEFQLPFKIREGPGPDSTTFRAQTAWIKHVFEPFNADNKQEILRGDFDGHHVYSRHRQLIVDSVMRSLVSYNGVGVAYFMDAKATGDESPCVLAIHAQHNNAELRCLQEDVRHQMKKFFCKENAKLNLQYLLNPFAEEQMGEKPSNQINESHESGSAQENTGQTSSGNDNPIEEGPNANASEQDKRRFRLKSLIGLPIDEIRNYFGEDVAFYIAFLQFAIHKLVWPCLIGLCIGIFVFTRDRSQANRSLLGPAFGAFLLVCIQVMLDVWKRVYSTLAFRWGILDKPIHHIPTLFTQAKQIAVRSIDSRTYKPHWTQMAISYSVILGYSCLCMFISLLFMSWRQQSYLNEAFQVKCAHSQSGCQVSIGAIAGPSILNGICIAVLGIIGDRLCEILTVRDMPETENDFQRMLSNRQLFVAFVNNYFSPLYISIIDRSVRSLGFALLFQVLFHAICNKGLQWGLSLAKMFIAHRRCLQRNARMSYWDAVFLSSAKFDLANAYKDTFVYCGYMMLFVCAYPFGMPMLLLGLLVITFADIFALLYVDPRPIARHSGLIEYWHSRLHMLSVISIIVNAVILTVSSEAAASVVFNFCRSVERVGNVFYWSTVCTTYCNLRVGSTCLSTSNKGINVFTGSGGPSIPLNQLGPVSTEMWVMFLFEHVLLLLKVALAGAVSKLIPITEQMRRNQAVYEEHYRGVRKMAAPSEMMSVMRKDSLGVPGSSSQKDMDVVAVLPAPKEDKILVDLLWNQTQIENFDECQDAMTQFGLSWIIPGKQPDPVAEPSSQAKDVELSQSESILSDQAHISSANANEVAIQLPSDSKTSSPPQNAVH